MNHFNAPLFFDTFFYALATGFLSLGILRYFRVPLGLTLVCAVLIALAAGAMCFALKKLKGDKRAVTKKEQNELAVLKLHLALEKPERVRALFLSAFAADGKEVHAEGEGFQADGTLYIPLYRLEPVTADEVALFLRDYGQTPFSLACNALTPEAEKLLLSFGKSAFLCEEAFRLLKRTDCYPEKPICAAMPVKNIKSKLHASFSKKNARPFFVGGLCLLAMSLFVLFPVYYLISGSVLMITAILVRAIGYA